MSVNDPLGDMLTRIRNALMRHRTSVSTPASKLRGRVLEVLLQEGFIRGYSESTDAKGFKQFDIELKYYEGAPVISDIKRVSKPGRREYRKVRDLPLVPMADVKTPWYLRMEAEDKPGVMSEVTRIFSEQGISIEGLIQKAPAAGESRVPVVVLTNTAAQSKVEEAVREIEALATIYGSMTCIRVETLD